MISLRRRILMTFAAACAATTIACTEQPALSQGTADIEIAPSYPILDGNLHVVIACWVQEKKPPTFSDYVQGFGRATAFQTFPVNLPITACEDPASEVGTTAKLRQTFFQHPLGLATFWPAVRLATAAALIDLCERHPGIMKGLVCDGDDLARVRAFAYGESSATPKGRYRLEDIGPVPDLHVAYAVWPDSPKNVPVAEYNCSIPLAEVNAAAETQALSYVEAMLADPKLEWSSPRRPQFREGAFASPNMTLRGDVQCVSPACGGTLHGSWVKLGLPSLP